MRWLRIRELVRKEFIQIFRDKKNRPLLIVAPLVQLVVFGYVVTTDVRNIRVGLFDQSRTPESRRLIEAVDANQTFRITHYPDHRPDLERLLLQRKIDLGFVIGPDFSSMIRRGQTAHVQILADGSMSNMAAIRISYTNVLLDGFNRRLVRELHPRRLDYGEIDARIRTWYNPNLESQYFYVPGIVAFLVMLFLALTLGHGTVVLVGNQVGAGTGFVGISLIFGAAYPSYIVYTQEIVSQEWRAVMAGCCATAWGLGTSVFLFGGGYIAAAIGYRSLFGIAMVMSFLSVIVFYLYFRKPRGEYAAQPRP